VIAPAAGVKTHVGVDELKQAHPETIVQLNDDANAGKVMLVEVGICIYILSICLALISNDLFTYTAFDSGTCGT